MAVKIFPAAKERILEIWQYTQRTWSEKQADKYVRSLVAAINRSQYERHRWRPVMDECLKGVFFIRFQRHLIFFRELSKGTLGVISILHDNMEIPSRLREDAERGDDGI